eukprot:12676415-Prorocentrum_lima.AAC.1
MTSSLVGSEMCIRDSRKGCTSAGHQTFQHAAWRGRVAAWPSRESQKACLLYTSDAADDMHV